MNRLIIIGNGFDLAHGLKTRYSNFIKSYILKIINELYARNKYSDNCIRIKPKYATYNIPPVIAYNVENALSIFDTLKNNNNILFKQKQLLESTLLKIEEVNWVDIEIAFFECLKKQRKQIPDNLPEFTPAIIDLNNQMSEIKTQLIEYLLDVKNTSVLEFKDSYIDEFCKDLSENDFVDQVEIDEAVIQSFCFLDFNYTSTLNSYVKRCIALTRRPTTHIKIHGDIDSKRVIFGYGDEFDEKYKELERIRKDEVLENIKSYQYMLSNNYTNLIRFVMGDEFQVYVCGHSCGISDKTLLNQIFTSPNCKSIKLFRYKGGMDSSDYMEKVYAIGRIIDDNKMLRNKVLPFDKSVVMK